MTGMLTKTDAELYAAEWRAVARNKDGYVMSLMAPGYFDEYCEWIRDMERRGYIVTELHSEPSK